MYVLLRRIPILFMTFIMLLSLAVPAQGAYYSDVSGHWAEQDILKMAAIGVVRGDGEGRFYPEEFTSRQEVIGLLVGLINQQALAQELSGNGGPVQAKGLSEWARGYVMCARQQGIISDSEVQSLYWASPAQRQEVAIWLSKTIKLLPVVDSSVLECFLDQSDINALKAPYIVPLVQENIIVGSNGYLRPLQPIKRCEIITLLSRAESRYLSSSIARSQHGQVVSYSGWPSQSLSIRSSSGQQLSLGINNQSAIFKNRIKSGLSALAVGDAIEYVSDGANQLIYAEVAGGLNYSAGNIQIDNNYQNNNIYNGYTTVEGEVYNIDWNTGVIDLMLDGNWRRFTMEPVLLRQYKDKDYDEDKPYKGDEVRLSIQNNQIIGVKIIDEDDEDSNGDWVIYKGTLSDVDESRDGIVLRSGTVYEWDGKYWDEQSGSQSLDVGNSTDIYYNGDDLDLDELDRYEGDTVYVAYDNSEDETVKIRVIKGSEYSYRDDISDIDTDDEEFELDDGKTISYDDATIFVDDGDLADEGDLDDGEEVRLWVDKVGSTYYAALIELGNGSSSNSNNNDERDGDNYRIYTGYLDSVDEDAWEIELDSGSMEYLSTSWRDYSGDETFELGDGADLYCDTRSIDIEDLSDYEDDRVYLAFDEDDDQVDIVRVIKGTKIEKSGEIDNIDTDDDYFEIDNESEDIYWDDDTIFIKDGELIDPDELDEGDDVQVIIDKVSGDYHAAVVKVD